MKKLFVVLLVSAVAVSCALAAGTGEVITAPDAQLVINYAQDGAQVAFDDDGGFVYGENPEALIHLDYKSDDGWLVNANPGDVLSIDFELTGLLDDPDNNPSVGIDWMRTEPITSGIIFAGMQFPGHSEPWTAESEIVAGTTVSAVNALYTFTEKTNRFYTVQIPLEFYVSSETDGTVTYGDMPAYRFSVPVLTLYRQSQPEEDDETVVPEPATYAYALMGLGSVLGIKRRIKK